MTFHEHPVNAFGPEAWTLSSQSTHLMKSTWFIIHPAQLVSLSTARWIEHTTRSTQLGDNLVHTMTFLGHLKESFPGLQPDRILSLLLDHFWGGGQHNRR
ncbi:MAG: hypothetical protein CMJ62_05130 [Planctomycetaceae bacterium]|nr:hypothetical protein [Planctomycetaceae bacterium]